MLNTIREYFTIPPTYFEYISYSEDCPDEIAFKKHIDIGIFCKDSPNKRIKFTRNKILPLVSHMYDNQICVDYIEYKHHHIDVCDCELLDIKLMNTLKQQLLDIGYTLYWQKKFRPKTIRYHIGKYKFEEGGHFVQYWFYLHKSEERLVPKFIDNR